MILALVGASGTGKSTVATEVASQLHWPVRHCGEEVRLAARNEGVHPDALPLRCHAAIDEATRLMAMRTRPLIIEGRFLHYVLAALPRQSLTLVLLDASLDVRMARFRERGNTLATTDQVILADQQDSNFVQAIYSEVSPHEATALITTDSLSVLEVADRVRRALDAAPV